MKKIYLLSLVLLIASITSAQPTINNSSVYPPGTTIQYQDADYVSLSPGNAGANQTYNFASASTLGNSYGIQYLTPTPSIPGFSSFPSSNMVGIIGTAPNDGYSYFTRSSSSIITDGYYSPGSGTPVVFNFTNPMTAYVFPTTFNTTFTDNFASNYSYSFSGITINLYRTGTISSLADGFGTLTTPTGTYTNCLRVKNRQVYTDSSVYIGVPIPAEITNGTTTSYVYYANINGQFIDCFSLSYDTTESQGTFNYSGNASYFTSVSTGLQLVDKPKALSLELFPNPATKNISFNLPDLKNDKAEITISDITGKVIVKEQIENAISENYNLDIEKLRTGLYFINIIQDKKYWQGSFVKQ